MQVVREKRLRKFSEEKLQGSSNYCSVSAAVKSRPLILEKKGIFGSFVNPYLVQLGPNLLDLVDVTCNSVLSQKPSKKCREVDVSNPTWNSVEPVSLEVFLL